MLLRMCERNTAVYLMFLFSYDDREKKKICIITKINGEKRFIFEIKQKFACGEQKIIL